MARWQPLPKWPRDKSPRVYLTMSGQEVGPLIPIGAILGPEDLADWEDNPDNLPTWAVDMLGWRPTNEAAEVFGELVRVEARTLATACRGTGYKPGRRTGCRIVNGITHTTTETK